MKIRWPPPPLGLGTPLNLGFMAPEMRPALRRWLGLAPLLVVAVSLLAAAIDLLFFRGVTIQRLPDLGSDARVSAIALRLLVSVYGSVLEELMFRAFLATLVAWLTCLALSLFIAKPKFSAQWVGTLVAAVVMGLWWHLGGRHDAFTVVRVLTLNMILETAYGWLYWSKGLELAMIAHTVGYLCLFFVLPALG